MTIQNRIISVIHNSVAGVTKKMIAAELPKLNNDQITDALRRMQVRGDTIVLHDDLYFTEKNFQTYQESKSQLEISKILNHTVTFLESQKHTDNDRIRSAVQEFEAQYKQLIGNLYTTLSV